MNRLRVAVGLLGEVLVTLGVLVLLYVGWELGWNSFTADRAQQSVAAEVSDAFAGGSSAAQAPVLAPGETPIPDTVFALLRIPRLGGSEHVLPVYEGTGRDTLAKGIGHYVGTALPGQIGNLGLAGHRITHGNPLWDIDTIVAGDALVVETRDAYYVYRAVRHVVVAPNRVDVVAPVPEHPGATPTQAWLTLTSFHPKYSSRERYILFAQLEQTIPRAQGLPASMLADPRQG